MNEREKSLKLAELMGWHITDAQYAFLFDSGLQPIMPYDTGATGLSQFAAILLKFPEVLSIIVNYEESLWDYQYAEPADSMWNVGKMEPTQENILNRVLILNGVKI